MLLFQLAQVDELGRLHQELLDARKQHDIELRAIETKLTHEHEVALVRMREETDLTLELQRQRLMALESHLPVQDEAIQFGPEPVVAVSCAIQTIPSVPQDCNVAVQVSAVPVTSQIS